MAQRRIVHPVAAGATQPCLVVRFIADRTHDGKAFRMLCIIYEFSRECLMISVARKLKATDVIVALCEMFVSRGVPAHIRSDNGPEFVALALRDWIAAVGAKTAYIEPGSPWENGYRESFNGKQRDERLNRGILYTLKEAQIVIENWRGNYNTVRPHLSLGYRPPAPEALVWPAPKPMAQTTALNGPLLGGRSPAARFKGGHPRSGKYPQVFADTASPPHDS